MKTSFDIVLMSTAYLPPVGWVNAAIRAGKVLIEAYETYPRQTYRNRCNVITANGPVALSIPVKKISGQKTKVRDIKIFYSEPWQKIHWRTIDAAYSNSPFFMYYKDELKPFYEKKYQFLIDYNTELSQCVFRLLGIKMHMQFTSEYFRHPEAIEDLRNVFTPKKPPNTLHYSTYHQVFEERHGFVPNLSIIDLIFNEGPLAARKLWNKK